MGDVPGSSTPSQNSRPQLLTRTGTQNLMKPSSPACCAQAARMMKKCVRVVWRQCNTRDTVPQDMSKLSGLVTVFKNKTNRLLEGVRSSNLQG